MNTRKGKQTAIAAKQTRQRILTAAVTQFAEEGFKGASLRVIAEEASTTHGLIRHHFGTKEDLWRAMFDDHIGNFEKTQLALLASVEESDPVELLKAIAGNYVRVSAQFPGIMKIILNDCSLAGPHLDYVVERMLPLHKLIEPVFLAVQEKGLLTHHDPDSFFIFLSTLGSVPIAMAGFTNRFYTEVINSDEGIEKHTSLVIKTLFND